MRHVIAPLSITLSLAFALVAAPAFLMPTLQAEDKKEEAAPKPIGEITLAGTVFTVALETEVKAGEEVEVKLTPKGALPKGTVRGWIGAESGKGSTKSKAHDEDGGLCVHAEAPKPIPDDAKIWIEIDVDGTKTKASVVLPK
jgi:2-keto-4-pentenoate hydratase/2-oxohepta-3-ene-1,7-dioic acid hydratase in catechol pathway